MIEFNYSQPDCNVIKNLNEYLLLFYICDPAWENHAYVHKIHFFTTLIKISHLLCKLCKACKLYWIPNC